jgi:hypothetical protein
MGTTNYCIYARYGHDTTLVWAEVGGDPADAYIVVHPGGDEVEVETLPEAFQVVHDSREQSATNWFSSGRETNDRQ